MSNHSATYKILLLHPTQTQSHCIHMQIMIKTSTKMNNQGCEHMISQKIELSSLWSWKPLLNSPRHDTQVPVSFHWVKVISEKLADKYKPLNSKVMIC